MRLSTGRALVNKAVAIMWRNLVLLHLLVLITVCLALFRNLVIPVRESVVKENIAHHVLTPLPPAALHIFQYGRHRTATTVQFNLVCVSLFLHIKMYRPELLNNTICNSAVQGNLTSKEEAAARFFHQRDDIPQAVKSHVSKPYSKLRNSTVVFTTALDKGEADQTNADLKRRRFNLGIVQDLETLSQIGISGYVQSYADFFNLTTQHINLMVEYFQDWDSLRQCCGMQMSKKFKNDLLPASLKKAGMKQHDFCGEIDINNLEKHFMNTDLYQLLDGYKLVRRINRPSMVDGDLDGTYCSRYANAIRSMPIDRKDAPKLNVMFSNIENHYDEEVNNPLNGLEHLISKMENPTGNNSTV